MEFVQVERTKLLEYVHYVEQLIEDHTKMCIKYDEHKQIAGIIDRTYTHRLDELLDAVLDQNPDTDFSRGMLRAYNILKGRV
jgi:hypothetical protein